MVFGTGWGLAAANTWNHTTHAEGDGTELCPVPLQPDGQRDVTGSLCSSPATGSTSGFSVWEITDVPHSRTVMLIFYGTSTAKTLSQLPKSSVEFGYVIDHLPPSEL